MFSYPQHLDSDLVLVQINWWLLDRLPLQITQQNRNFKHKEYEKNTNANINFDNGL